MKNLPIGIQEFSKLIKDGYLYIDKTEYIHQLISSGSYYFLSRPRRFGKSLLLNTIKEMYRWFRDGGDGAIMTTIGFGCNPVRASLIVKMSPV